MTAPARWWRYEVSVRGRLVASGELPGSMTQAEVRKTVARVVGPGAYSLRMTALSSGRSRTVGLMVGQ